MAFEEMELPGLEPDRRVRGAIGIRWKQVISGARTLRSHARKLRVLPVVNRAVADSINCTSFGQLRFLFDLPVPTRRPSSAHCKYARSKVPSAPSSAALSTLTK